MDKCSAWHKGNPYDRCYATKECEPCLCNGEASLCDFYRANRDTAKSVKKEEKETKPQGWISVGEGMPDDGMRVLTVQTDGVVRINMASGGEFGWICIKITNG